MQDLFSFLSTTSNLQNKSGRRKVGWCRRKRKGPQSIGKFDSNEKSTGEEMGLCR